eukprot:1196008-Prorocentrum_minimum.AAC.2
MDCVGSLSAWGGETQREEDWNDDLCGATQQEAPLDERNAVLYCLQGFGGGLDALEHDVKEKLVVRESTTFFMCCAVEEQFLARSRTGCL